MEREQVAFFFHKKIAILSCYFYNLWYNRVVLGALAQLVEQLTLNQWV